MSDIYINEYIDIIWFDLYVLYFVQAPFNASWIIFEVLYDIFILFYKIERVIVVLLLANNYFV